MKIKRTERGWGGHFCCADKCLFRRNTLLESEKNKIIVSTVGAQKETRSPFLGDRIVEVAPGRYYETLVFYAKESDGNYIDIDVTKQISVASQWSIPKITDNSDNDANNMHEKVVNEIIEMMEKDN